MVALAAACCHGQVLAQPVEPPAAAAGASEPAAAAGVDPGAPATAPVQPAAPKWEGAIGLIAHRHPEYSGSDRYDTSVTPGFFLRWGRWTVTNSSGFVTRRADDINRGLGFDFVEDSNLRVNAALRFDQGRSEDSSPELAGLGDIERTIRVRVNGTWRFDPRWRLGGAFTIDALGRGGGQLADMSLVREARPSPYTIWTVGAAVTWASDRYMQSYFGVTPEQSVTSGYAPYEPGSGLRDASLNASWRHELGTTWVLLANASVNRLVGSAAGSPIVRAPGSWSASFGAAYRF